MNGISDTTESLRQQFQQLQEQHQKKLLLRKQRQTGAPSTSTAGKSSAPNTNSAVLEEESGDNLQLELNHDFSEDFTTQDSSEYEDANRQLKDENGRLYKLLAERDEEMRILRKQADAERKAIIGSGLASDTAATRIMELSKKNRELASDTEKERRKVKQLSKRLSELQTQNSTSATNDSNSRNARNKKSEDEATAEEQASLQVLQEKLKQALAKMAEYRNQCEILKKEARLAQKVIAKECGEGVSVTAILNEPSGWRGRQQQITTLQNKVNELKEQLNEAARSKSIPSSNALFNSGFNHQRVTTPSFHEEKHKHMLRRIEKNKKEEYERVGGELEVLKEQHSKLQTKFDAAKTRNKILTSELKGLKSQTKMLVDKGTHDDELIAALMREQERLQKTLEKKNTQMADRAQSRQENAQHDNELVVTLTRLCKEREEKVAKLEHELKTMVSDVSQLSSEPRTSLTGLVDKATITDHCGLDVSGTQSPLAVYTQNVDDTCNLSSCSVAVEPSSRRRRIVRPSSRNSSASALPPTPPRSSSGRRKTSGVTSDGRCHSGIQFEAYRPLYEATKVERDKLVELVSVLQQREREAQQSVCKISSDIKGLQRTNVELEKKLAVAVQSQERNKKPNSTRQKRRTGEVVPVETYQVEELETQLAIQKDENDALKEALEATLRGKKEDFLFYQDIIDQTKQVFLQGLHHYRQSSAPS